MQTKTKARRIVSFLVAALFASVSAATQPAQAAGVTDSEIRIGNIMPYTGPLAAFGLIGRAEAAYFDRVNARGGINGRKVKFISCDDSSNATAVEQTRELVEIDRALLMFGSFGTPGNLAVRNYLNDERLAALCRLRRRRVGASKGVSVDDGLAADVPVGGTHLCQLYPGRLSEPEDRRALGKCTSSAGSCSGDCRRGLGSREDDRRRYHDRLLDSCRSIPRSTS